VVVSEGDGPVKGVLAEHLEFDWDVWRIERGNDTPKGETECLYKHWVKETSIPLCLTLSPASSLLQLP
jgi:hypothetical protein